MEPPYLHACAERHRRACGGRAQQRANRHTYRASNKKALSATGPSWSHGERPALGHTSAYVAIKISGCELGHIALSGICCIYLYPFLDIRGARKRASVSNWRDASALEKLDR